MAPVAWAALTLEALLIAGASIDAWRLSAPWLWRVLVWHAAVVVVLVGLLRRPLDLVGHEAARRAVRDWHAGEPAELIVVSSGDDDAPLRTVTGWRRRSRRFSTSSASSWSSASAGAGTSRRSLSCPEQLPELPAADEAAPRSLEGSSPPWFGFSAWR